MPIDRINIGDIVEFHNSMYHLRATVIKISKKPWEYTYKAKVRQDLKGNWHGDDVNFDASCFKSMTFLGNEPFNTNFIFKAKNGKEIECHVTKTSTASK